MAQSRYLPYGQERWTDGAAQTDFTYTGQRADNYIGLMDYLRVTPIYGQIFRTLLQGNLHLTHTRIRVIIATMRVGPPALFGLTLHACVLIQWGAKHEQL